MAWTISYALVEDPSVALPVSPFTASLSFRAKRLSVLQS